jgi:hypothetical protein
MSSPGVGLSTEGPSAGGGVFEHELREKDDPFSEHYVPKRLQGAFPAESTTKSKGLAAGLGIDEEVEVTRKPRAPRVKLDEHRYVECTDLKLELNNSQTAFSCWYPQVTEESEGSSQVQRKGP